MRVADLFAVDYAGARAKFREAAAAAGAVLESHRNRVPSTAEPALVTDTAWLGPRDAPRLLILLSGTHGVEGLCGSALQVGLLRAGILAERRADIAVLMIHALNPFGFAVGRRVTEGNIDLNRNFVDHRKPYPRNPVYNRLRDALCPSDWSPAGKRVADAAIEAFCAAHSAAALNEALILGQYDDPDGLLYGGRAPTWSNRTLRKILRRRGAAARSVALVDFHSGLGAFGVGQIINNHLPGHPGAKRVSDWYAAEAAASQAENLAAAPIRGDVTVALDESMRQADVTAITLEFGTVPLPEVFDALRADNWLYVHGRPDSPQGRDIKSRLRAAFYPERDDWREPVWDRATEVARKAISGLAENWGAQADRRRIATR